MLDLIDVWCTVMVEETSGDETDDGMTAMDGGVTEQYQLERHEKIEDFLWLCHHSTWTVWL